MIVWKEKNPHWYRNKNYQRRLFLEDLGLSLVSNLLDHRSKNAKFLNQDILNALAVVGYPVKKNNNVGEVIVNSTSSKRKRCSICPNSRDRKTSTQCCRCSGFICNEHSVKRSYCVNCTK